MTAPYIMLVDDEVPFVETMSKRLVKRGLKVISANSGEEAIVKLDQETQVDVIILDVKMPGMDGLETLQKIKKKHPLKEVIMLTGHATIESAIDGMKLGAFDYLMKPCDIDILISKVDEAAKKKQVHDSKIDKARIDKLVLTRGY
ncbi:MAG: response regulator [Desulfobacteraceae bacterium]|nr:response regulator [Desulfobacteraceae bacterium]